MPPTSAAMRASLRLTTVPGTNATAGVVAPTASLTSTLTGAGGGGPVVSAWAAGLAHTNQAALLAMTATVATAVA